MEPPKKDIKTPSKDPKSMNGSRPSTPEREMVGLRIVCSILTAWIGLLYWWIYLIIHLSSAASGYCFNHPYFPVLDIP
jgi:hypothetical protein